MNPKTRKGLSTLLIWVLMGALILYMISGGFTTKTPDEITLQDFVKLVEDKKVQAVHETLGSGLYTGLYTGSNYTIKDLPNRADFTFTCSEEEFSKNMSLLIAKMQGKDADAVSSVDYPFTYTVVQPKGQSWLVVILPYVLLFGSMALFMWFMYRQQGGGKQMANFGRSRAREYAPGQNPITFKDVAGADEEKLELQEIVDFLKEPQRFSEVGARIPKGVLLVGPPGTGKTLMAKAVAGEAKVPFFSISGSDFVEMFVGVGASRVRDLFNTAKRSTPAVIFIDEIDAVGRQRGAGLGGGHDEKEQTLNQLLVEMDGFAPNEGIIVIAATNRPDILDPALQRPGRFDRQVTMNYPDVKGREAILHVHARNKKFEPDVDLAVLAQRTPGFTGADLENVLNEAAILTARAHRKRISQADLEEAITRVQMGPEKKSRVVTEEDKRYTAYHESGHAILAIELPKCDSLHEVSIISRGMAAGYTDPGAPRGPYLHDHGRPGGRGAGAGGYQHRRQPGPEAEHRHRPEDGGAVRHEREPGARVLRRGPGGVHRPGLGPWEGAFRGRGRAHRPGGQPHPGGPVRPGQGYPWAEPGGAPSDRRPAHQV